jgi:hypothetical protein
MSGRAGVAALLAAFAAAQPAHAAPSAGSCEPKDLSGLAGWNGVWAVEGADAVDQGLSGRGGGVDYKLIGLSASWNEEGWARMAAMLKRAASPTVKQGGWGFPMMMDSFSEFAFVISPAQTAIINQYREVRSIYTDGRGHPSEEDAWPTNWGDSTGCWDGDTLVIDTVDVRFDPAFNIAAPPLSEQAHFVERLRLVAPGRIENEMTVTDPKYLTAPWVVRLTYIPAGIDRLVLDASQDRNDTVAQTITASPKEDFVVAPLAKGVALSVAQLDKLVGHYAVAGAPAEFEFEFVRKEGRLYLRPPGFAALIPMIAQSPLVFVPIAGGEIRFVADASGRATGLEATQPDGTAVKANRKAS